MCGDGWLRIGFVWIALAGGLFLLVSFLLVPGDAQYVRLAIDAGDYDYARSLLAPRLRSPDPPLWVLREAARVAALRGYPAKAASYLERLLEKSPGDYQDRLELARLYLDLYEPEKASRELGLLLRSNRLPDREMQKLARSYDLLDLPSSALLILHRLAAAHPGEMGYWKAILVYDSQTGNDTDMARTLRTLTRQFPGRIDYLVLRLTLAYRRGRDREVLRMMDRIGRMKAPPDAVLVPALRSLFRLGRPVEAYLLTRRLSPGVAKDEVLDSAAWLFYRKGYRAWALSVFEDLIDRHPQDRTRWEVAIWLSDKMGWYPRTRFLLSARQKVLPVSRERYHAEILDLDRRFGLRGQLQRDLLGWLGRPGGPSLSDLRLGWQTAEEQANLPLAAARMRQAVALFPGERSLPDNLAETWEAMNRPDLAGALLAARGLSTGERGLLRRAIKLLLDAGEAPPAAGLYFRLLASDSRKSFSADQFALYRLYAENSPRPALSHLVMALERFPDLSATMEMELARILIWKGHYKKARRAIDRVIRSFPENRALLFQASDWFVEADQLSLALVYDERLVRLLPGDPQGLSLLIRDRRWAGQEGKTLASYKRLLGLDPDNREALVYLGDNAYDHGFFRKAIGFYRRAVAGGDIDYALLYRLGMAFRKTGNPRMARRMFGLAWDSLRQAKKRASAPLSRKGTGPEPEFVLVSEPLPSPASPGDREAERHRLLYAIKILSALGHDREAFRMVRSYLARYPGDREGLYWKARLLWKRGDGRRALEVLDGWLGSHPSSKDFLILRAEILTGTGEIASAQRILWRLHRRYPQDPVVWNDLLETYRRQGRLDSTRSFDSHIFSQGETQAPRVSSGLLSLYNMDQWSLHNQNFAVFYPGGASYSFDAKAETPLYGSANYFAGRTEYLGGGARAGWGTNDYTYAGIRWSPAPGWQVTGEAGDTRLTNSPGFYVNLSGEKGPFFLSLQGFDNMVWGDFGQSIVRDGLQTGYMAALSWTLFPRLSLSAESWLFDYTLDDRTLPFGELDNTLGMADLTLDTRPRLDLVAGYEDWSVLFASPASESLVPILARQQFAFAALAWQARIKNRLTMNLQGGGYENFVTSRPAYEGGAGISYRISRFLEVFGSGDYFNQSVLYNGASQEAVWGFNLWF